MTDIRKLLLGGFTAVAACLIVTGVAWACVPYYGSLQVNVSGNAANQNSGTVAGKGGMSDHQYCTPGTDGGVTPVTPAKTTGGDTLTITVSPAPATFPCSSNKLTAGWNKVLLTNATTDATTPFSLVSGTSSWSVRLNGTGCWANPEPAGNITLSSISVDANGNGTVTHTLGNLNSVDASNRASMLCIGTTTGSPAKAIPVPIQVTSTT